MLLFARDPAGLPSPRAPAAFRRLGVPGRQHCLLEHRHIVKRVHLPVLADPALRLIQPAQDIRLQPPGLHIVGVLHQPLFRHLQSRLKVSPAGLDRRQIVEAHLLLLVGPGCLVESVEGLVVPPLIPKTQAQIVVGRAVVGIGILPGSPLNGLSVTLFRPFK